MPIARSAPDTTATIPAAPTPKDDAASTKQTSFATQKYGEGLVKPFDLPAAPRARMRSCGETWQAIKLSGEAGSDTWREFATKCLAKHIGSPTSP